MEPIFLEDFRRDYLLQIIKDWSSLSEVPYRKEDHLRALLIKFNSPNGQAFQMQSSISKQMNCQLPKAITLVDESS